jgi:hypothetical protein
MRTRLIPLSSILLIALTTSVEARGGHGYSRGVIGGPYRGGHFAGGRHGNDSSVKAASDDRDKLLNTKLKSICRGC